MNNRSVPPLSSPPAPVDEQVGSDRIQQALYGAVLAACSSVAAAGAVAAAPDADEAVRRLDPVVVVATRSERLLREVAGNVTVVTRDELGSTLTTSLDNVFRYTPGIDAAGAGTRFGTEGLIVRGIGGNRVFMELDGAPLNHQFAVGSFANATRDAVNVGVVERIEVLHGPASALYGGAALGGVVSMWTPDPGDLGAGGEEAGVQLAQALRSDDDSSHTQAGFSLGDDRLGLLGMAVWRQGNETDSSAGSGPRDRQDYDQRSALAKLVAEDPWGHRLSTTLYHDRSDVDSNLRAALGTGRFATTTRLEGDDDYELDLIAGTYELAGGRLDRGYLRGYYETVSVGQDTLDERAAADRPVSISRRFDYDEDLGGLELNLGRDLRWGRALHRTALGAEWTGREIRASRDATETGLEDGQVARTLLGETFPRHDFPTTDTDEYGVYLQDEIVLDATTVIAGLRWDRYELTPQSDPVFEAANPGVRARGTSEDELSPKLGVLRRFGASFDVYAQYAHGFRAPSFEDAYLAFDLAPFNIRAIPNPDLRPESSDGIEAGLRWRGRRTRADLNLFYTHYDDFIETRVRVGVDPDSGRLLFQSRNIGEARIYGAEFRGAADVDAWLPGLSLELAAFWSRGENDDNDEPLNSVGPAQAVIGMTWRSPRGWGEASLLGTFTARHSRLDESRGQLFEAPGYGVLDLFVSRRFGRHLLLRGGVENLLDKTHWRWADVRGLAFDDPLLGTLSRPGRSVAMNMRWNF